MAEGGKQVQGCKSMFSDPVFKKISQKNGEINKLEYHEMCKLGKKLNLCVRGSCEVLRKRLKSHYQTLLLNEANVNSTRYYYPYYVVIDFEATCEEKRSRSGHMHEIIEFPAVLIDAEALNIKDTFHEYVKPFKNNILSEYCKELTGISQEQIDAAALFPEVLNRFRMWMDKHRLNGQYAIVTDGPWDMGRFLYTQIKVSGLSYPKFAKRWVNIKKIFSNFYDQRKPSLDVMLSKLNFVFEGRPHSGIDDAKNISRVLIQMLKDGASIRVNERIDLSYLSKMTIPAIPDIVKPVMKDDFCKRDESGHLKENDVIQENSESEEKKENCTIPSQESNTLDDSTVEEFSALNLS